jgi:hypothetical protein
MIRMPDDAKQFARKKISVNAAARGLTGRARTDRQAAGAAAVAWGAPGAGRCTYSHAPFEEYREYVVFALD